MEHISYMTPDIIDDILSKRGPHEGAMRDEDLALALFAEEAEGLLHISKSRARVGDADMEAFADELFEMERMAQYDRLVAIALSEGRDPPPPPIPRGRARRRRANNRCE